MKKTILALGLLATAFVGLSTAAFQEPEAASRLDQHAWLKQLVGEWETTSMPVMGAGDSATKTKATESVRAIGELWILTEGRSMMSGMPMHWVTTIGYDPKEEAFVGTWVDNLFTHMWTYRGTLDESGKILTLEAEGPDFANPAKTKLYRDAIEIVDADTKRASSSMQGSDGEWITFLRSESKRVK